MLTLPKIQSLRIYNPLTCRQVRLIPPARVILHELALCFASKRLIALICMPHLYNTHGIGDIAKPKNPSRLVAHLIPSFSYTVLLAYILDFEKKDGLTLDCKEWKHSSKDVSKKAISSNCRSWGKSRVGIDKVHASANLDDISGTLD